MEDREPVMPRPPRCRWIDNLPAVVYFKPRGIPAALLEEVVLSVDEFEALRLADRDGLYQEEAAARMGVSRQTFGRILESAHRKTAEALTGGKALRIEGGEVAMRALEAACPSRGGRGRRGRGGAGPKEAPR